MFGVHEQNYFPFDLLIDRHNIAESNFLCINPARQFSRSRDIVEVFRVPFSPARLINNQMSSKG